jgi:hypothetical protein
VCVYIYGVRSLNILLNGRVFNEELKKMRKQLLSNEIRFYIHLEGEEKHDRYELG